MLRISQAVMSTISTANRVSVWHPSFAQASGSGSSSVSSRSVDRPDRSSSCNGAGRKEKWISESRFLHPLNFGMREPGDLIDPTVYSAVALCTVTIKSAIKRRRFCIPKWNGSGAVEHSRTVTSQRDSIIYTSTSRPSRPFPCSRRVCSTFCHSRRS